MKKRKMKFNEAKIKMKWKKEKLLRWNEKNEKKYDMK